MNTTDLPRLPEPMTRGGASVALRLPIGAGSVAHKPYRDSVPAPVPGYPKRTEQLVFANCARDDDPCVELSAGWADHQGAQACTEKACFPGAEPR